MLKIVKQLIFALPILLTQNLNAQQPVTIGSGNNFSGVTITTSGNVSNETGSNTLNGNGMLPNLNATSRFLGQATLGADYETILQTSTVAFPDWIDQQMTIPIGFKLLDNIDGLYQSAVDSINLYGGIVSEFELDDKHFYFAWTKYLMESPDILRSRVALALSEIFIISEDPDLDNFPRALADYYDLLLEHSFGNYRDLIEAVTYHPAMGYYLTHLNNPKSDPDDNVFPDENYAREIMQLFSIGLFELNSDGTKKTDANGQFIETYDETDIAEFAKIFTGLSWGDAIFFNIRNPVSPESVVIPMKMFDTDHEPGTKNLLNGFVVPNRNPVDGDADIADALNNLYNHENVGPFLALRLIQRLVKSNPSPAYIERVTNVFNDDGTGVRGNIGAMVKAILLDEEARSCGWENDPYAGKLREPMIRQFQLARSFNAYVPNGSGIWRDDMNVLKNGLEQRPLSAPSVFNFFLPDYQPIGPVEQANKVAPEFQITDSRTAIAYPNLLNRWLKDDNDLMDYSSLFPDEVSSDAKKAFLDFSDELAMAGDADVEQMIERLNLIIAHGQLKESTRAIITNQIKQIPATQPEARVRIALFLIMMSPDYLIIK